MERGNPKMSNLGPRTIPWTRHTTRVAHDGDFFSDATPPSRGGGGAGRSRQQEGGPISPYLVGEGTNLLHMQRMQLIGP